MGGYAGQQGFTTSAEILDLAAAAGVSRGRRVLDLCCGAGGSGLLVAQETGCRVVGLDRSREAISAAGKDARRRGLDNLAGFVLGDALFAPFASSSFDAVLLYETMLAFEYKTPLLREVRRLLRPGGRFAFTLEEGEPLTPEERRGIPDGKTVWPVPEKDLFPLVEATGLRVLRTEERTASHARVADLVCSSLRRIRAENGEEPKGGLGRVILAHERWAGWLRERRVRKLAIVVERPGADASAVGG